jgi:hypothetical protein
MDRHHFLCLLFCAPALPYFKSEPAPASGTIKPPGCGFCGSPAVFDRILDLNLCPECGAHESSKGWERPDGASSSAPLYPSKRTSFVYLTTVIA